MEKVVYILGAGFSAPLGLPVMSNFLDMARDLYRDEPDKYAHFGEIFNEIRKLSVAKNYFKADLFNIEEIFSILDMLELINGYGKREAFQHFISDVIQAYTPVVDLSKQQDSNTPIDFMTSFFGNQKWIRYCAFVSALLGHSFKWQNSIRVTPFGSEDYQITEGTISASDKQNLKTEYSVITLNYDLILENIASTINSLFGTSKTFIRDMDGQLAKLHGSIDTKDIMLPSWNKTWSQVKVMNEWKRAYTLLRDANHIRIIGYSLPSTDTYIKYLFKAAIINSPHLKQIDVICLDENGEIKKRYEEFILFQKYRFLSVDLNGYLNSHLEHYSFAGQTETVFDKLEHAHNTFFQRYP